MEGSYPRSTTIGVKNRNSVGDPGASAHKWVKGNPENGTNGWYLWCGMEWSEADDFFHPCM